MEQVLVAYASKYGATAGIAERIAKVLREAGVPTAVIPARQVRDLSPYGAVVLGSGAYMFHWLKDASRLLKSLAAEPSGRPVWLFTSGPTGQSDTDAFPEGVKLPKGLLAIADGLHPRDVAVFAGVLDMTKLNRFERFVMTKMKAVPGDYRNWDTIDAWARGIAEALSA
ncbi:MAG: flavodoxin domain-containing protein [Anaerolineae bacterium]|nr:flavodoxin domain-containing protein [Anaerolineae bacterium]